MDQPIYYTKKIMFIPTVYQTRVIYQQFNLIKAYKFDLITEIFSQLISIIKDSSDGIASAKEELKKLRMNQEYIVKNFRDSFERLYQRDKVQGAIYTAYEKLFFEVADIINASIIRQGKRFRLSSIPFYFNFANRISPVVTSFYTNKSFRKTDEYYKDSLHVYIPYLSYVRLKDRKGYFTYEDWKKCYKVMIKKDNTRKRNYLIFFCKTAGENSNESWSSQNSSIFRKTYASRYKVDIAPSNISRLDPTLSRNYIPRSHELSRNDRIELRQKAEQIEIDRQYAACFITRDFSFAIRESCRTDISFDTPFATAKYIHADFRDLKPQDYLSQISFDTSLHPNLHRLIDRINDLDRKISQMISRFKNHNTMEMSSDELRKRFSKLLTRRKRIRSRIHRIMNTAVDKVISTLCHRLPYKIEVYVESYSLSPLSEFAKYNEYSTILVHMFLRKLMNKAQLLQIPLFVLNPDSKAIDVHHKCPSCGSPTQLLGYHLEYPIRDFNTYYKCTNEECIFNTDVGYNVPASMLSAFYLPSYFNAIMSKSKPDRLDFIDQKYLNRWYPISTPYLKLSHNARYIHRFNPLYSQFIDT